MRAPRYISHTEDLPSHQHIKRRRLDRNINLHSSNDYDIPSDRKEKVRSDSIAEGENKDFDDKYFSIESVAKSNKSDCSFTDSSSENFFPSDEEDLQETTKLLLEERGRLQGLTFSSVSNVLTDSNASTVNKTGTDSNEMPNNGTNSTSTSNFSKLMDISGKVLVQSKDHDCSDILFRRHRFTYVNEDNSKDKISTKILHPNNRTPLTGKKYSSAFSKRNTEFHDDAKSDTYSESVSSNRKMPSYLSSDVQSSVSYKVFLKKYFG